MSFCWMKKADCSAVRLRNQSQVREHTACTASDSHWPARRGQLGGSCQRRAACIQASRAACRACHAAHAAVLTFVWEAAEAKLSELGKRVGSTIEWCLYGGQERRRDEAPFLHSARRCSAAVPQQSLRRQHQRRGPTPQAGALAWQP